MSVNIRIKLDVNGLVSREQAEEVQRAVGEVLSGEGLDREVELALHESDGEFKVTGRNEWPVSISRVRLWEPQFEAQIEGAVKQVSAEAEVRLDCVDADLERALEEGTL
ncbi:hypothetical protein GCM10010191_28720 [Actinomadura vinacea]|uniref:Uncharacterized protein n=1 Tax=Actinomadura vinacea TaxID=115336 RepID=A0ABN3IXB0_9ACTN